MEAERTLASGVVLRLLSPEDAGLLAKAYAENREYLAPWEPARPEEWYTEEGQVQAVAHALGELMRRTELPLVLVEDGSIIGGATLSSIVRGAFQNAHLGYWIAERAQGQGIMTQTVGVLVEIARDGLGLHRIEAATLPRNAASQRVLEKNGFEFYGLARSYLQIAGSWQDHRMYQRIL
ncbi:GNAT family N-acetyltransferase [Sinomonas terrae]|uniref:GNAT family N-acetyltransferase n=1 Tax=Sinomonas terrae TaxID=2908838 RepID=A0ABS9U6Y7_9MICC|nr:GNAT family N-acetyltransferase [Sinomonas terrae]MCH6472477.1 GNAT family N-acetyltransferase [Sinomonas terrae]